MKISALYTYPIKSTATQTHKTINLNLYGLEGDREWAVISNNNKCLTSRDYPQLLHLNCISDSEHLSISYSNSEIYKLEKSKFKNGKSIDFKVHKNAAFGFESEHPIHAWMSDFLRTPCQLVLLDKSKHRPILTKHGGSPNEKVGFSDSAPILIISEASLRDLNNKLEEPISMHHFRPNIVLTDCDPYEEENWKEIKIGNSRLRIIQGCERCVLTTINPITLEKHPRAEPLTTLSTYKIGPRGGIIFGVHAVPIEEATLNLQDPIEIVR